MVIVQSDTPGLSIGTFDIVGSILLLLGAYLTVRLIGYVVSRLAERTVEHRITVKMVLPLFKAFVYASVTYYIVRQILVLTPGQLLAISGLIGAAIGFGVKDLFSSVVGGFIILIEQPYRVGDQIELDGHYGEVTDIGIRATRINTPNDTLVVIPNDAVFGGPVANANAGQPEMLVVVEFTVSADADLERAMQIVEEALITSRYVFVTDERQSVVLSEDEPYYRTIRGKAYVNDTRNEFTFKSDVTRRVRQAFDAEGIEKPPPVASYDGSSEPST